MLLHLMERWQISDASVVGVIALFFGQASSKNLCVLHESRRRLMFFTSPLRTAEDAAWPSRIQTQGKEFLAKTRRSAQRPQRNTQGQQVSLGLFQRRAARVLLWLRPTEFIEVFERFTASGYSSPSNTHCPTTAIL